MIEITTLGNFSIKVDNKIVSEKNGRTKKLWKLLSLLILNKDKPLPIQKIIEYIWPDEDIEFATKAMHNLIFRLKRIFAVNNKPKNYIIFSNNGYILNIDENFIVDIYIMEENYERAKNPNLPVKEKIARLEKIIGLYKGEYFSNQFDDTWIITAARQYANMFINTIVTLSDLYLERKEHDKMFQICDKALRIEPIEESIYFCMIKGMIHTDQIARAIVLCEKYFDILYKEMGILASDKIQKLYNELKSNYSFTPKEQRSLNEFKFGELTDKAFFCNPKIFKEIYKYELRQFDRKNEKGAFLSRISINRKDGAIPPKNALQEAKKYLHESCLNKMRKSDVFTTYSCSEYLILLTNIKYENHNTVTERIKKYFYENCTRKDVFLNFQMIPLTSDWVVDE